MRKTTMVKPTAAEDLGQELSVDAILGADDAVIEPVPVPEWGGTVHIKSMTGTERDAFEISMRGGDGEMDLRNARARLLVRVICTKSGVRKFGDDQATALGKKNAAVLGRLYDVATRMSGLNEEEKEELKGNSEAPTEVGAASS